MSSIYELTGDWLNLYAMADEEDIDEQTWLDTMEAIEGEIEVKAENTAKIIKQLTADADAITKESARLKKRAEALENRAEWLKKNLQKAMEATGKTKFKTDLFSFGIQKNGGKAPLVIAEGTAVESIPKQYQKITTDFDNTAIREYLENGGYLTFASLGDRGESLRIR